MATLLAALLVCTIVLVPAARAAPPLPAATPVIVDTDAGTDDLLALAFLLARRDVHIEAITVVNGLAHVPTGAANVLALLQLAGRTDIPVYMGSSVPLAGHAAFPAAWRKISDELPGVDLPKTQAKPQAQSAVSFLVRRLFNPKRPVRILALGPLTNLGAVLRQEPFAAHTIEELLIMGGAVNVPGNLSDGGVFKTENKTAEWNFYIDPLAASIVFSSKAVIRLIPLDATQQVPIHADFVKTLQSAAKGTLEQFAAQVLASDATSIRQGYFYAWDPLAAVALVDVDVVRVTPMAIEIEMTGNEQGRSVELPTAPPNARVALTADAAAFRREFLAALAAAPAPKQPSPAAASAGKTPPANAAPQTKPPAPPTPAPPPKPAPAAPAAPPNGKP